VIVSRKSIAVSNHQAGHCVICGNTGIAGEPHKPDCPVGSTECEHFDVHPFEPGVAFVTGREFYSGASEMFIQMLSAGGKPPLTEAEFDAWVSTIKDRALDERGRAARLFQDKPMFNRLVMSIADLVRTKMIDYEDLGCLFRAVRDQFDPH
jgi:hypothetical protein